MKSTIKKTLLALVVAGGIATISMPASAYWRDGVWYGNRYHGGPSVSVGWGSGYHSGWGYRHGGYGYKKCRWVPGHWRHGNWIPAHKRCWY